MRQLIIIALATAAAVASLPLTATAQRGQTQRMPPAPPTVAPPIVYPLPPLMTLPAGGLPPLVPETPRFNTRPSRRGNQFGFPVYTPYWFADTTASATRAGTAAPNPPSSAPGFLRLFGTPSNAQVFVDGLFVGTVQEIDAPRTLTLTPGPHHIEFRAPQFRTAAIDVRISSSETLTYRAALEPEIPPPPPHRAMPPGGASASTMYVIPRCYIGNIPPRASRLPPGCDIARLEVLTGGAR
jgi:hypothetical protein